VSLDREIELARIRFEMGSLLSFPDDTEHRDGTPWDEAPMPSRWHRCSAQTSSWLGFDQVLRCACGAIRNTRFKGWLEKNSRRKR